MKEAMIEKKKNTYMPWTFEFDDLQSILVDVDFLASPSRLFPILNGNEQ